MDGSPNEPRGNMLAWDETDVHNWFLKLGFPQYESQIRENNVTGEILCALDSETIKDIGIATVGQRLAILKAIYLTKLAHNIPIEPDDYIPPSEADDRPENLSVDRLYSLVKEQGERLRHLESDNRRLSENMQSYIDEVNSIRSSYGSTYSRSTTEDSPTQRQSSFKWQFSKPGRSPTKAELDSPHLSPQKMEHEVLRNAPPIQPPPITSEPLPKPPNPSSSGSTPQQPAVGKSNRQESSDNLKSFKVSLEDPAWKVLPAALKKYKINNDDWQNYAMFICYGSTGNRIERCLSYDEKPLLLFQRLKDANKSPVFMLKHIKDIRSPIAVAQQKQAARKASSESPSTGRSGTSGSGGRTASRPPKLQVHNTNNAAPPAVTTATSEKPGWPEAMSPLTENKKRPDEPGTAGAAVSSNGDPRTATISSTDNNGTEQTGSTHRDPVPSVAPTRLSYAVAIYPYMADQEDEFDVVVGDTFIITSRARGWWVVQRDPEGKGIVELDSMKQGWVPAGCLLETNVPVSAAIEEAAVAVKSQTSSNGSRPPSPVSKTPILPLSFLSTSFPGIALMEYKKKGEEELDLMKDDTLRVFKRYNHWSYAVKEDTGDRGWVPSWFIGKIPTSGGAPTTPSVGNVPTMNLTAPVSLDNEGNVTLTNLSPANPAPQVSPMSSAFPIMQQARTTTVI